MDKAVREAAASLARRTKAAVIGVDTNVLVGDLPRATEMHRKIERRVTEQNPGFLSMVALGETAWFLDPC